MFTLLASLCAGIAGSCIFLLTAYLLGKVDVDSSGSSHEELYKLPLIFRLLLPFTGNLAFITEKEFLSPVRRSTHEMLQGAGLDQILNAAQFLGLRILLVLFSALIGMVLMAGGKPLCAFLLIAVALIYPDTYLRKILRIRNLSILKSLPNILDMLTLSVEAGKDFLSALRDIVERRQEDFLGLEFKRVIREIQLGKQRQEALRDMALRINQPELTSVLNAIIQADELGVGIGQLLRIQGDQLRHKRFARAETLANEAPVKILFPIVLFIFPSVFIILVGPIISQALQTFSF